MPLVFFPSYINKTMKKKNFYLVLSDNLSVRRPLTDNLSVRSGLTDNLSVRSHLTENLSVRPLQTDKLSVKGLLTDKLSVRTKYKFFFHGLINKRKKKN